MTRRIAIMAMVALTGCGGPCAEVAAIRKELQAPRPGAAGPHAEVRIPLVRANVFLAEVVREPPVQAAVELPDIPLVPIGHRALTAVARSVELRPAADGRVRFALRIELLDDGQPVTMLAAETEVEPQLVRGDGASELVAGFGPKNLVAVRPVLEGDAAQALGATVRRWLPAGLAERVPAAVLDRATAKLTEHLTGAAYRALAAGLLGRLGTLSELRIRLPALPIARVAIHSTATALVVGLTTDLPVRRGLGEVAAAAPAPVDTDIAVRMSGSTVAELGNWAIAHGALPAWYSRDLKPEADGEFRPHLDYLADDAARPFKIHVVQDRGGCSYFRVGLRPAVAVVDDHGTAKLEVASHDQWVETARAAPLTRLGLWIKQLVWGATDHARRAAATVQLTTGGRTFTARAVRADLAGGELDVALALSAAPAPPPVATR